MLILRLSTDLPNIKSVSGFPLCWLFHAYRMSQHTFLLMIFFHHSITNKSFIILSFINQLKVELPIWVSFFFFWKSFIFKNLQQLEQSCGKSFCFFGKAPLYFSNGEHPVKCILWYLFNKAALNV